MKKLLGMALILLLLAAAGAGVLYIQRKEAPAPPPPPPPARLRVHTEGRVAGYPDSDITVGTELGGVLLQAPVEEGQSIQQGQLIAVLDSSKEERDLAEALARIKEITVDVDYQEGEVRRASALHAEGIISRQALDQATARLKMTKARLNAALAVQDGLRVTKSKRRILSPFEGTVISRKAHPGETLLPGAAILRLSKKGPLRVEAEIDEFDLARIQIGMPVTIQAEGTKTSWKGFVDEIPKFVVPRTLKPEDPSRPADTRVLLAKVAFLEPTPLKLGQRVELEIGGEIMKKSGSPSIISAPSAFVPSPSSDDPAGRAHAGLESRVRARLAALSEGDLDLAKRLSLDHLRSFPQNHWTIRLLIAHQPETLRSAVEAFGGVLPDLFIVSSEGPPEQAKGYHLFLGHYPSRQAAAGAVPTLPSHFTDKPMILPLRKLPGKPRASREENPILASRAPQGNP